MKNLIPTDVKIETVRVSSHLTRHMVSVQKDTSPEDVVDAVMEELCTLLEGINTLRFGTGVKFFWPILSKPGSQIVAHVRISSKDTKFQQTTYHLWVVRTPNETKLLPTTGEEVASDDT